jgi:adenosylhomocysteine nucleosidase
LDDYQRKNLMKTINEPVKSVAGHRLLYVMATEAEYGDHLKQLFSPVICGVGPVESAMHTTRSIIDHGPVDLVVSLGSAGSSSLDQAHVYQVSAVSYRDMDASAFGFVKGETPFLDLPAEIDIAHRISGIPHASISTGADVVSGDSYSSINAEMVDMESWAVMRACHAANVSMVGLRGISDGAHPVAKYEDWTRLLHVIDERLAQAVMKLEAALETGELKL